MKRIITAMCIALALTGTACSERTATGMDDLSASFAANAAESGNKLQCFSGTSDGGYNGTCTLIKNGASLNTVDGDADPYNNYAGVYVANTNLDGRLLSEINKLAFTYSGSGAAGGSPRFSIPIDQNNNGTTEGFAYVDTQGCNSGDANVGTLDAINDATCLVNYNNIGYTNWSAFVTANPTYRVTVGGTAFVIADAEGTFTITNVQLGRGSAKGK